MSSSSKTSSDEQVPLLTQLGRIPFGLHKKNWNCLYSLFNFLNLNISVHKISLKLEFYKK